MPQIAQWKCRSSVVRSFSISRMFGHSELREQGRVSNRLFIQAIMLSDFISSPYLIES